MPSWRTTIELDGARQVESSATFAGSRDAFEVAIGPKAKRLGLVSNKSFHATVIGNS